MKVKLKNEPSCFSANDNVRGVVTVVDNFFNEVESWEDATAMLHFYTTGLCVVTDDKDWHDTKKRMFPSSTTSNI